MGSIELARTLHRRDALVYQNRDQQYQFQSALVERVNTLGDSARIDLVYTDMRTQQDMPFIDLHGDAVFYRVRISLIDGSVGLQEVRDNLRRQNRLLFGDDHVERGARCIALLEAQLSDIVRNYVPAGDGVRVLL